MEERIIKQEKVRKVFLDGLKYGGKCISDKNINWTESCASHCVIEFKYGNTNGEIELISYNKKTQKLLIKYNSNSFEILTASLIQCNLARILKEITVDFKIEVGTRFKDDRRDITITDREYRDKNKKSGSVVHEKWYKYTCNICNWTEGWTEESNLLKKRGCSVCRGLTVVEGINDIASTDKWMIPYVGEECAKTHTRSSHERIRPFCPSCLKQSTHLVSIYSLYKNKSSSCDCKDNISYPNKFLHNFLKQLDNIYNFKYLEFEYSPKWVGKKSYDSYFIYNNKKYIIEMDGSLGHGKRMHSKSKKTSKESLEIDKEKDRLAMEHDIEIIRIDCDYEDMGIRFEYIKNNIINNDKLDALFDLNNVDFQQCNEYGISNLVRIISTIKQKHPSITCNEIAKITGYGSSTIVSWLKIGNSLNLCYYNAIEESSKSSTQNGKNNGKPIICIETGKFFKSIHECVEKSIELFGILLNKSGISEVCNNKRSNHKGYHFKYTSDLTDEEEKLYNLS